MALDSRIPLAIQVPRFDTPYDLTQGALSLRQLMQNVEMAPLVHALRLEQLESRAKDQELRALEMRRKAVGTLMNRGKTAAANALGMFLFGGDPEAARQSYRQQMAPIWQQAGYTPEQMDQATMMLSPEMAERYLGVEGEDAYLKLAERAVGNQPELWDTGEPAGEAGGGAFVQTAGGVPEWLNRQPSSPDDWRKWDQLIMISKSLKKEGGLSGKIEDAQFIPVPGVGVFPNPYWRKAKEADYALRAKFKIGTGTEINIGDRAELTRPTENELQQRVVDADAGLARLDNMIETFKPEFLTLPEMAKQKLAGAWSSLGMRVSPETRQQMENYAWFMADAYDNMSLYIKMITGAAMSQPEAERIGKSIPNPDTDNPVVFESKMRRTQIVLRRARDAYAEKLRNGISLKKAERAAADVLLKGLTEQTKPAAKEAAEPPKPRSGPEADPLGIR